MKLTIFNLSIFILILFTNSLTHTRGFIIRPHGGMGWNIGNHATGSGRQGSYFFGAQIFPFSDRHFRIGYDLSYMRAFSPEISGKIEKYEFFNVGMVIEGNVSLLILQMGLYGFYIPTGDNNVLDMGFMLATGLNIPISDTIDMPILIRFDFLSERIIMMNGVIGISFKINFYKKRIPKPHHDQRRQGPNYQGVTLTY